LETEAIHVMREVAAEFETPCPALFRRQGFHLPAAPRGKGIPSVGHSDAIPERRDRPRVSRAHRVPRSRAKELGAKLIVRTVDEVIANGTVMLSKSEVSRNKLQIPVLLGAIEEFQFDCASVARAATRKKPARRNVSSASRFLRPVGSKNQRPEIWNLYNAKVIPVKTCACSRSPTGRRWMFGNTSKRKARSAEHLFHHERECFRRGGQWATGAATAHGYEQAPIPLPVRARSRTSDQENDRPCAHDCGHDQHWHD